MVKTRNFQTPKPSIGVCWSSTVVLEGGESSPLEGQTSWISLERSTQMFFYSLDSSELCPNIDPKRWILDVLESV